MEASTPEARSALGAQHDHWQRTFARTPDWFGAAYSAAATKASELFKREDKRRLLELGAGQGRDTLFFARNHFHVVALDYSQAAVDAIETKAKAVGSGRLVETVRKRACHVPVQLRVREGGV